MKPKIPMKTKLLSLSSILLIFCSSVFCQDSTTGIQANNPTISFKVTADLVSTYIWRGTVASKNPNIQPTMAIVAGGLELGIWGSTDFRGTYKEIDPYVAYTIKSFKIGITDYDWNFQTLPILIIKIQQLIILLKPT